MGSCIEDSVAAKIIKRGEFGVRKHGVSLADSGLTRLQALIHAQEEAMDLANYLEVEIQREQAEATADDRIPWAEHKRAAWAAKDADGLHILFEEKPRITKAWPSEWIAQDGWTCVVSAHIPGPWQESLRKRPENL
jgi:hypothetical protein